MWRNGHPPEAGNVFRQEGVSARTRSLARWRFGVGGAIITIITIIDQLPTWEVRPLRPDEVDDVAEVLGLARLDQGDGSYLVAWAVGLPVGHVHLATTDPPQLQ